MKIINSSYEILTEINSEEIYKQIEKIARTCYKSEDKITNESSHKMISNLIKRNHEAMLEHYSITVKFICDRGISHELVRHRIASFAQESTRYCNYNNDKFNNELTFIKPFFFEEGTPEYDTWYASCFKAEQAYLALINIGRKPEEARTVLPNSIKTEICVTMNLREWRHFFRLRALDYTGKAHPQMKELTIPLLREMQAKLPIIFNDLV